MIPPIQCSYIACSQGRWKCYEYKVREANYGSWTGTGVDTEGTVGRARVGIGKVCIGADGADRPKASRSER